VRFLHFLEADATASMMLAGNTTRCTAIFRHDAATMLYVLRTLIDADYDGQTYFVIDPPSTAPNRNGSSTHFCGTSTCRCKKFSLAH
jgi:hypothetical protein